MRKYILIFTYLLVSISVFAQKKKRKKTMPHLVEKVYEEPPKILQVPSLQNNIEAPSFVPMESLTQINATKINGKEIQIKNVNELKSIDLSDIVILNIVTNLSNKLLENEILDRILNEATQLKELKIDQFSIDQFPEIKSKNYHLKKITLDYNNLKIIPLSIANLVALEYFSSTNPLQILPANFSQLKNLKELHLNSADFSAFPNEIFDLNKLSVLYISGNDKAENRIKEIPDKLQQLSELKEFGVSTAAISTLPKSISSLKKLTNIDFSNNRFEEFPEVLAPLTRLNYVAFANNPLNWTKFSHSIKKIKWSGLFFLYKTGFSKKQYEEIQKVLSKIDVYYDGMND